MSFVRQLKTEIRSLEEIRDFVFNHEPCGYYCDEAVGHVDHKYTNWLIAIIGTMQRMVEAAERGGLLSINEDPVICNKCGAVLIPGDACSFCEET